MNICVLNKYRVKYVNKYTFLTLDYDSERIIKKDKVTSCKVMTGYDLLHCITDEINKSNTIEVIINDDDISIHRFDPDGTNEEISIKFSEIIKTKKKGE